MGRLRLGGYESGSDFSPVSKSVIVLTLYFDPSGILPRVGSVSPIVGRSKIFLWVRSIPPTTGQSLSRIVPEGFRLWIGSGPPAYCHVFTIFSWKLGIMVVNDSAFQSWNHSVGPSF